MREQHNRAQISAQRTNSEDRFITPKDLAYEFNVSEHLIRTLLRLRFRPPHQGYWRFKGAQARRVRDYLMELIGK